MATPNLSTITTVTPSVLASAQLASGANTVYTVPANKAVKLTKLILANVTASAVAVTVTVLKSGDTVDGTHEIVHAYSLAANDNMVVTEVEGMFLGDGDSIRVNAGAATAIDATLNGLIFA